MNRYDGIIAELAGRVPELAEACQPTVTTFLERCQLGRKEPLSPEDIEYLRALQADNPDDPAFGDEVNQPLSYLVFENALRPLLLGLLHDPTRRGRLQEILNWLKTLLEDEDEKGQTLVAIGICEALISSEADDFPALFPFLGKNMRQSCRDFLPYFHTNDKIRALLNQ